MTGYEILVEKQKSKVFADSAYSLFLINSLRDKKDLQTPSARIINRPCSAKVF